MEPINQKKQGCKQAKNTLINTITIVFLSVILYTMVYGIFFK